MTLIPLSCPIGSSCCGGFPDFPGDVGPEFAGRRGPCGGACGKRGPCSGYGRMGWNWLGSVTVIPCESIASFTHNAI
ncbi:MAG: hypothetical protein FWC89_12170 [Defluviitaleaceae bacterium]|nr:hypothetical protein [Defluviitaleaceae bacterium]